MDTIIWHAVLMHVIQNVCYSKWHTWLFNRHCTARSLLLTISTYSWLLLLHAHTCACVFDGKGMGIKQFIRAGRTLAPEQPQCFPSLWSWYRPPANARPRTYESSAWRCSPRCRSAAQYFRRHLHPPVQSPQSRIWCQVRKGARECLRVQRE